VETQEQVAVIQYACIPQNSSIVCGGRVPDVTLKVLQSSRISAWSRSWEQSIRGIIAERHLVLA
jgi:hypothetical protein